MQVIPRHVNATVLLVFLAATLPASAVAQTPERPRNEYGVFGVLPLANGSLEGVTSDRRFYQVGASYTRVLVRRRQVELRWVSEIMPLEFLREPFFTGTNIQAPSAVPGFTEYKTTYGVGTNPVGADVGFIPQKRVQPFVGVHVGISYFTRNVLAVDGAQFNFMIDGRAGLRFAFRDGKSLSVAYMFQHMSNAFTAESNPGIDSHMIHVSYALPFRFHHARK
jgi:hypothetical protein